jgi:hypothetical protein
MKVYVKTSSFESSDFNPYGRFVHYTITDNDLYFANRLTQWMIDKSGIDAQVGYLHFSSTSLHCFENDRWALGQLIGE